MNKITKTLGGIVLAIASAVNINCGGKADKYFRAIFLQDGEAGSELFLGEDFGKDMPSFHPAPEGGYLNMSKIGPILEFKYFDGKWPEEFETPDQRKARGHKDSLGVKHIDSRVKYTKGEYEIYKK